MIKEEFDKLQLTVDEHCRQIYEINTIMERSTISSEERLRLLNLQLKEENAIKKIKNKYSHLYFGV